jgi:hypothetical protein
VPGSLGPTAAACLSPISFVTPTWARLRGNTILRQEQGIGGIDSTYHDPPGLKDGKISFFLSFGFDQQ